jgi:hypothetical protein
VSFTLIPSVIIASDGIRITLDSFSIAVSTVYGPLTEIELSFLWSVKIIKFRELGSIEIVPLSKVAAPKNVESIKSKMMSEMISGK